MSEKKINFAIDVGGTHSRVAAQLFAGDSLERTFPVVKRAICSKGELRDLVLAQLQKYSYPIGYVVIGFAGAVLNHEKVDITNWICSPTISKQDLANWGLPEDKTLFVNDMELASFGVLALQQAGELNLKDTPALYTPAQKAENYFQNMLIIAPGTGLGTASVVHTEKKMEVIPSEIQHMQVPALDIYHQSIIEIMLEKDPTKKYISYEDMVCGRGLKNIYSAVCELEDKPVSLSAAAIARKAIYEEDEKASTALNYFYRCAGRVAQALALCMQPYSGIFLCGDSTMANQEFIPKSDFVKELHNCPVRHKLLNQFPVYMITDPQINTKGGLWAAKNLNALR
jgi:glucokinase